MQGSIADTDLGLVVLEVILDLGFSLVWHSPAQLLPVPPMYLQDSLIFIASPSSVIGTAGISPILGACDTGSVQESYSCPSSYVRDILLDASDSIDLARNFCYARKASLQAFWQCLH